MQRAGVVPSGAVLEAPALVAGLDDVAVVREAVEERGGHLGIAGEDARPLSEGEVGGHEDRGLLIKAADAVEQELPARLREGEIAELVEHDEVHAREVVGDAALASGAAFSLETVHQVDDVEEAASG